MGGRKRVRKIFWSSKNLRFPLIRKGKSIRLSRHCVLEIHRVFHKDKERKSAWITQFLIWWKKGNYKALIGFWRGNDACCTNASGKRLKAILIPLCVTFFICTFLPNCGFGRSWSRSTDVWALAILRGMKTGRR